MTVVAGFLLKLLSMSEFSWLGLLKKAAPLIAILGAIGLIFHLGSNHGESVVQHRWDQATQLDLKKVEQLKINIAKHEDVHRQESRRINDELVQANKNHAVAMATLRARAAGELQQSDARAAHLLALSQAGPAQQRDVAEYAARLDRTVVEGRQLVGEFRTTLEQRDATIRALGAQILADRKLTGENGGQDAASSQ